MIARLIDRARRLVRPAPPEARRGLYFGPFPAWMGGGWGDVVEHPVYRASHARLASLVEAARGWRPEIGIAAPALPHLHQFEPRACAETLHQLSQLAVVRAEGIRYDFVVGVSLGELAAGAACGAQSPEDVVGLLLATVDAVVRSPSGDLVLLPLGARADVDIPSQLVMRGLTSEVLGVRDGDRAALLAAIPKARALEMHVLPHTPGMDFTAMHAAHRGRASRPPAVPLYASSLGGRVEGKVDLAYWLRMVGEMARLDELLRALRVLGPTELIRIGSVGLDRELAAAGLLSGRAAPTLSEFLETHRGASVAPTSRLDPENVTVRRDSHVAYERCRHAELLETGDGSLLAIGHAAVSEVLRRADAFSSSPNSTYPVLHGADGADHARRRRALAPYFTPARQREREPAMRRHTAARVAALRQRTSFALVADFAYPIPFDVTAEWLGLGALAAERLLALDPTRIRWTDVEPLLSASGLLRELHACAGLGSDEVAQLAPFLLTAGLTTVTDFVVNAVCALHERPVILSELRAGALALGPVVDELLRLEPPVHALPRRAVRDTEVAGQPVAAGTIVHCGFAAANRDPAVHREPNLLDVEHDGPRSLTFGVGPHYCLGAATGRAFSEILLGAILHDLADFAPAEEVETLLARATPQFAIRRRVDEIVFRRVATP